MCCENDRFRSNAVRRLFPREKALRKFVAFFLNMATEYCNNTLWHKTPTFQ